jgi:SAM-dependent methyltransferase
MSKRARVDTKETGLEIGLILGKHLLRTEHLHYGYWTDDLALDLFNLPRAQENHSDFIISHIPDGTRTILDVGCGAGRFAAKLISLGYTVDCVSPSTVLTEHARKLLGDKNRVFECRYEDLQTDTRYDVIIFSESFQYVNLEGALKNSGTFLKNGGHLLICDFFKTEAAGESVLRGGHKLSRFYDQIAQHPFRQVKDIDITAQTAPNLDLVNDVLQNAGLPIWRLLFQLLDSNHPIISRMAHWKFGKKIDKINRKYFSNLRNAENFAVYKSYRLLLYQKTGP